MQPTETVATSVAISLGGAGAGGDASATVSPTVQAVVGGGAVLDTPGDLSITSSSNSTAAAQNKGVAGGLIAVGDSNAEATVGGETSSTVASRRVAHRGWQPQRDRHSIQSADASATSDAGGIGVGADATATVMVTPTVQAVVGDATGANTARTTLTAGESIMVSSSETTTEANATSTNNEGGGIVGGTPHEHNDGQRQQQRRAGRQRRRDGRAGEFHPERHSPRTTASNRRPMPWGGSLQFRQEHRHHEPH